MHLICNRRHARLPPKPRRQYFLRPQIIMQLVRYVNSLRIEFPDTDFGESRFVARPVGALQFAIHFASRISALSLRYGEKPSEVWHLRQNSIFLSYRAAAIDSQVFRQFNKVIIMHLRCRTEEIMIAHRVSFDRVIAKSLLLAHFISSRSFCVISLCSIAACAVVHSRPGDTFARQLSLRFIVLCRTWTFSCNFCVRLHILYAGAAHWII